MWGPGLAAIMTTRFVGGGNSLCSLNTRRFGPKRIYLLAWLLPPLLAAVTGVLTWILRVGQPDLTFPAIQVASQLPEGKSETLVQAAVGLPIVTMLTFGVLSNLGLTLGEELGWRGFLLPALEPLGRWQAILLSNFIWGLWHAPMVVQGHAFAGQPPILAVLLMVVFCLLVGMVLSWFYFATRSPWAPALAHAAVNATAGLPVLFFPGIDPAIGGHLNSLTGFIGLAAFVGWLVLSKRLMAPSEPVSARGQSASVIAPQSPSSAHVGAPPATERKSMIQTIDLTRHYGSFPAVQNLELAVEPGELFGFLGPNGAGKTTTIRMLVGLLRPTSGTAIVSGYDVQRESRAAKQAIGYLAQTPLLYERLTGREFLRFVGGLYGLDDEVIDARVEELLALLELADKADQLIESYSGGMRHKIGLCGALIHEPPVLILDEPLAGLDPYSARRVKDMLRDLCKQGRTVFMSTHVLEIAERVCDRVGILDRGHLIAVGTIEALHTQAESSAGTTLEDLFLQLTGGDAVADVATMLE